MKLLVNLLLKSAEVFTQAKIRVHEYMSGVSKRARPTSRTENMIIPIM